MNINPDETIRSNAKLGCLSWKAWNRLTFHQRGKTLWYLSDIPDTLFNSVVDCDEGHTEFRATIKEICTEAERRKVPLAWMINREEALSKQHRETLHHHGFVQRGSTLGMILDLSTFTDDDSFFQEGGYRVEAVRKPEELALWSALVMRTYGFPEERIQYWSELHKRVGITADAVWQHFLVFSKGNPIPIATCSLFTGKPPLHTTFANLAVTPGARGKGIGSALTRWSLAHAKKLSYSHLTLYASNEAIDLYRKLGFTSHHTNHLFFRAL